MANKVKKIKFFIYFVEVYNYNFYYWIPLIYIKFCLKEHNEQRLKEEISNYENKNQKIKIKYK